MQDNNKKDLIDPSQNEMEQNNNRLTKIKNKIKNVKHFEIIVAFVIALVGILIYFIASDINTSGTNTKYEYSGGNELSMQVAKVLSNIDGVGNCDVLITYDDDNEICGVVVVADGGDNINVKVRIVDAVCTLVEVDGNKIKIYKMNKNGGNYGKK